MKGICLPVQVEPELLLIRKLTIERDDRQDHEKPGQEKLLSHFIDHDLFICERGF